MPTLLIPLLMVAGYYSTQLFDSVSRFASSNQRFIDSSIRDQDQKNATTLVEAQVQKIMTTEGLTSQGFLAGLRCAAENIDCDLLTLWEKPAAPPPWASQMLNWTLYQLHDSEQGRQNLRIRVRPIRNEGGNDSLEISYSRNQAGADVRLSHLIFLNSNGNAFSNALTTSNHRCLPCHIEVFGNVANYEDFLLHAPLSTKIHGWWLSAGPETQPPLSPAQVESQVPHYDLTDSDGTMIAPNASRDGYENIHVRILQSSPHTATDANTLPLTAYPSWTQLSTPRVRYSPMNTPQEWEARSAQTNIDYHLLYLRGFEASYQGPELPYNLVRQKWMLPKINPDLAYFTAQGQISAPRALLIPKGGTAPGSLGPRAEINGTYQGHVILHGTTAEPIRLQGRVVISGDVVLWGVITGQGEIIAGGNIFVPRDLTLLNPPSFVNAEASELQRMTFVGSRANSGAIPKQLATSMGRRDRVALLATNNLVLEDPFTSAAPGIIPFEAAYVQSAQFRAYRGRFAYERATGYALDAELLPSGDVCYLRPWDPSSSCRRPSEMGNQLTEVPYIRPPSNYANDQIYYEDVEALHLSEAFQASFWPREMLPNGGWRLWISRENFANLIVDPTSTDLEQDAFGARRREIWAKMALPNPFNASAWTGDSFAQRLEETTGILSQAGGSPAHSGVPGATTTLDQTIRSFFNLAIGTFRNTLGKHDIAVWASEAFTRLTLPTFANRPQMHWNGRPVFLGGLPLRAAHLVCGMMYTRDAPLPNAANGNVLMDCTIVGSNQRGLAAALTSCSSVSELPSHGLQGHVTPPCPESVGLPSPARPSSLYHDRIPQYFGNVNSTLYLKLKLGEPGAMLHNLTVHSSYYDPNRFRPTPRVRRVDAFLFANHFITRAGSGQMDSQIRIHGGMVAKDVLGNYISPIGRRRNAANQLTQSSTPHWNLSSEPGLWLMHDPRFQYVTELPTVRSFIPVD